MEFVIVGSDQRSDSERVQYWVSGGHHDGLGDGRSEARRFCMMLFCWGKSMRGRAGNEVKTGEWSGGEKVQGLVGCDKGSLLRVCILSGPRPT